MDGMTSIPPAFLPLPAAPPPNGVKANLVDPPSLGYQLVATASFLYAIMAVFLLNRLYVKIAIVRNWSWDDITCAIAALFTTGFYAATVYGVQYCYLGVHFWNVTLGEFLSDRALTTLYITEVLSCPALGMIKLTFFLLFLQIFAPEKYMRWACWFGFVCVFLVYSGFTITWFVLATPGRGVTWQQQFMGPVQKGNALDYPIPIMGLIFDLYILVLPLVGVSRLQLSFRRKMGVALIFLTAILAVISSILRIVYTVPLAENQPGDFTYNLMVVYITINVEMMLGVILACVPSFSRMCIHNAPKLKSYRSKLFSSLFTSRFSTSRSTRINSSDGTIPKTEYSDKNRLIRGPFNTRVTQVSQWELEQNDSHHDMGHMATIDTGNPAQDLEKHNGIKIQTDIALRGEGRESPSNRAANFNGRRM